MHASLFNVRVPLHETGEVFLMNTLTDAQLIVGREVTDLLDRLPCDGAFTNEELEAASTLAGYGFIVPSRDAERRDLDRYFDSHRENDEELRLTVLTTLQCNFACDYCIQGDHGDYNRHATKMSFETAGRVLEWTEERLEAIRPKMLALTFFGGEPLLNLPVLYFLAERLWERCQARGVQLRINVITNGLLLTPEVVDRLLPFGLNGVKITLDGDRDTHDRMRPLRGGQGTFDRIVRNIRMVAGRCQISIGGNFDESSVDSYPALLDFLREQEFADKLAKVAFKPIIRQAPAPQPRGVIPLTVVGSGSKPLNGACMTTAGSGSGGCDSCHFLDGKMAYLREETSKRGFATVDGVHMGPCEIHQRHSYTIGPDGSLFACPGFAGHAGESTGHIDGRFEEGRSLAARRFEKISAWEDCNDCAFIPVCAGGCTAAAFTELHDMNRPNCHKPSFEAGLAALAREAAQLV